MSFFTDDPAQVLDFLSDPIVLLDERWIIVGANRSAGNLVGVDPLDLIGRSGLDWVHEPDRADATDRLSAFLDRREDAPVSVRFARADGSTVWAEVTGAIVRSGGSTRIALSLRNVDWRHEIDLETTRIASRSHVLVDLALRLQSVTPGGLLEALDTSTAEIGYAVGAAVVAVHELTAQGSQVVLRARWADPRSAAAARAIPPSSIPAAEITRWLTTLGLAGRAIELDQDRQEIAEDVRRAEPSITRGISLALRPGERLLGALTLGWTPPQGPTNSERDFLARVAEILGSALLRVRDHQALAESEALFRDLFEDSSAIMYLVDPDTLCLVDVNEAAAAFYGYPREEMAGMALHELTEHSREELADLVTALRQGGTTVMDERQRLASGEIRIVEIHATPIPLGDRTLDLAIVQDVTQQRQAIEHLERLASTDELTGALNRRRFFELTAEEIARCERYGRDLALLMLDLDHFKVINDTYGHLAGDAALAAVAATCSSHLRANDRMARVGGEEFAVLLPESGLDDARSLAERIRASIGELRVPEIPAERALTVSVGAAQWEPGWDVDALYGRADRMLYEAKKAGRDRFVG